MANNIDIVIKSITLLHREHLLQDNTDTSKDIILELMPLVSGTKTLQGGSSEILDRLKELIVDLIETPGNYDQQTLVESLTSICASDKRLLNTCVKTISTVLTPDELKRSVVSLRGILTNFVRSNKLKKLFSTLSYNLQMGKFNGGTAASYIDEVMTEVDSLRTKTNGSDLGVIDELSTASEDNGMEDIVDRIKTLSSDGGLQTGWKEVNNMIRGSFRPGSMVRIDGLQHNYKSGFVQSLVCQLATCNKPYMRDESKKPMILYISFEDDAEIFIEFMYTYLYYNENKVKPDLTTITKTEIAAYIKAKLSVNGYVVRMLRVNPSEWTYKDLFNKVLILISEGYEIHGCVLDYLAKLPTTGCADGPAGTAIKDLFNRCRNFFSAKHITLITPHQMSVDAKQLLRNGVEPAELVKEVVNKGYTEMSKALDQIVDLELAIHKAKIDGKFWLTIHVGKDRRPGIVEEKYLYAKLPFPYNAPIVENINDKGGVSKDAADDLEDLF